MMMLCCALFVMLGSQLSPQRPSSGWTARAPTDHVQWYAAEFQHIANTGTQWCSE